MDISFYQYLIAIVGGAFAGAINTLAGNGSAITLTILTEVLGLPGNMANGTNRIGIFSQSVVGTLTFYKHGRLNLSRSWLFIILTILGAIGGVITAIWVSNEQFRGVFRFLMIFMFFVILIKPKRWLHGGEDSRRLSLWVVIPLFLGLGFYGGFIQMGMGVFFLAVMVLGARYNIIDSNAVKLFVVAAYTLIVIFIFQWQGLINWKLGLILAIGQSAGGWLTATYASRHEKSGLWAYRLLIIVVILAIVKLFNLHHLIIGN